MVNRSKSQPANARSSRDASTQRKPALQRVFSPQPTKRQTCRLPTQTRHLKSVLSQPAPATSNRSAVSNNNGKLFLFKFNFIR